jgi:DNA repair protein RadC
MRNKAIINEMSIQYGITAKRSDTVKNIKILSSIDAYKYAKMFYFEDINIYESSFVIFLDRSKNTKGYAKISQGGTSGTVIDIKILYYLVITCLADSIILVHNHPSGNLQPSNQDKDITNKIKNALSYSDISLVDHIIITDKSYYSFADEGNL